jgi:hypothetical protein
MMVTTPMLFVNVIQIASSVNLDLITLPSHTSYVLKSLDIFCYSKLHFGDI